MSRHPSNLPGIRTIVLAALLLMSPSSTHAGDGLLLLGSGTNPGAGTATEQSRHAELTSLLVRIRATSQAAVDDVATGRATVTAPTGAALHEVIRQVDELQALADERLSLATTGRTRAIPTVTALLRTRTAALVNYVGSQVPFADLPRLVGEVETLVAPTSTGRR